MKKICCTHVHIYIYTHTAMIDTYIYIYIYAMNTNSKKGKAVLKISRLSLLIETSRQGLSDPHPLRTWSSLLHLITIAGFLLSMLLDVATWWIDVDRWTIFYSCYHRFTSIYIDFWVYLLSFFQARVPSPC